MLLDKKEISFYKKNGVVLLKNAITKDWINKLKIGVTKNFKKPSKYKCVYEKHNNKELFYDDYCNWQRIIEYKKFLFDSNIGNIASQLMSSKKVNIFQEHVLIKEIGSQKKTPWHQDQSYYCVEGKQNVSFWIPLDKVLKNSSPEFIGESHKWKDKFLPTKFFGNSYTHEDKEFKKIPNIEKIRNKYNIFSFNLNLGDIIAFNFATVHGAPGNKNLISRRAFSARFMGDDARYVKRKGEMSPPFPNLKLKNGQKMDCATFPVVFLKS